MTKPLDERLALWDGADGYKYVVVRLHDLDEERLVRIEEKLDSLLSLIKEKEHQNGIY